MVAAKVRRSVFASRLAIEIVFLLSRHPVFADEPSLVPWQMLLTLVPDPLRWSVGHPHADSSKTSLELSFRSGAPSDVPPSGICQHVFSRHREDVRNVPLTGTAAPGNRPDHLHIGRVYLEVPRDTDCPGKFAICEPWRNGALNP
jgi:hypothetical protein